MAPLIEQEPSLENLEELKKYIRRLNSKAGQMKMDLHDLAEGLPNDYENLVEQATKTYKVFQELDILGQKLKAWEQQLS